jgi:transcriptional regulator with XRE-family HTH domain
MKHIGSCFIATLGLTGLSAAPAMACVPHFGKKLLRWRESLNLSQRDLALRSVLADGGKSARRPLTQTMISEWEEKPDPPDREITMKKLAAGFGVGVDLLRRSLEEDAPYPWGKDPQPPMEKGPGAPAPAPTHQGQTMDKLPELVSWFKTLSAEDRRAVVAMLDQYGPPVENTGQAGAARTGGRAG